MKELSEKLAKTVWASEGKLRKVCDADSGKAVLKGGWSRCSTFLDFRLRRCLDWKFTHKL